MILQMIYQKHWWRYKTKGYKILFDQRNCNQNGVINAVDRASVISRLGSNEFNIEDLDGNGIVNAADRAIVVSNLGRRNLHKKIFYII